ncbi:esterase/lipase family protein [Methyloversatilis discipulorum]|uniref:esterase/lipase family protein n=1 Tax=Methyloversatilis discipulorum TaxID=1119528 RepID=UPI003F2D0AC8
MEPVVIVHGWSDDARSFRGLAKLVESKFELSPTLLNLAEWISMDDDVTFADLANAMQTAWAASNLPTAPRSTNIIVHSTGALIVRDWMTRYYKPQSVPIKRFLMLAPANFGSQLAHKGHSFIGRAIKGWKNYGFETGEQILKGLELASPFTWSLAERDMFSDEKWYGAGRILATVLVGNEGYDGVRAVANESASDGTVRISTANLNCSRVNLYLDENQVPQGRLEVERCNGAVAFGIINSLNHSSIVPNSIAKSPALEKLHQVTLEALEVDDADYPESASKFKWQERLFEMTEDGFGSSSMFKNVVTRVSDNVGNEVSDYFIEFYRTGEDDVKFEKFLYEDFLDSVHAYKDNGSYRALYLDVGSLLASQKSKDFKLKQLFISVVAHPQFHDKNSKVQPVGYRPLPPNSEGGLRIPKQRLEEFFAPYETMLVNVVLSRTISSGVFAFKRAG